MAATGRELLLLTVALLQLLTLCSCQLDCTCTADRNRNVSVELDCERDEESFLQPSCNRAEVEAIPAGYSAVAGYGVYKLYRTFMNWPAAVSFCELEGGRLAIPQDETHYAALLAALEAETPSVGDAYLGVNDIVNIGVYVGVDGNPAPYLPWRTDEPSNGPDNEGRTEHCVVIGTPGTNDINCLIKSAFFCEIPTALTDYTWVEGANRFVKVHRDDPQTYDDAYNTCVSEGGSLAVLESWDAAQAVLRVLSTDVAYYFVGFDDNDEEGVFVTSTGRLLTDMEFQNWDSDQPDNGGGAGENCLAIAWQGYYDDLDCQQVNSFICQITRP